MKLETVEHLVLAHPFIKGFRKVYKDLNDEEAYAVANGNPIPPREKTETSSTTEATNLRDVYTTTFYIGLCVESRSNKCKFLQANLK
jgi:poly(A) polymerase